MNDVFSLFCRIVLFQQVPIQVTVLHSISVRISHIKSSIKLNGVEMRSHILDK